jgi:hypothetical protein
MPQIFVKIKRHLYWVVAHFEIWAASQISAVMGPAALPKVALDLFWMFGCFYSQVTANAVIAKSEIEGFLSSP